jgi:hypothetical protein
MNTIQRLGAIALVGAMSSAHAQNIRTVEYDAASGMFVDVADHVRPQTEVTLFDSWNGPVSLIQGYLTTGFDTVGEDMFSSNRLGGIVTDIGYTLANLSTTRPIRYNRIVYSFWSLEGDLIATRPFDEFFAVAIQPGQAVKIHFGSNQFRFFDVTVPDQFYLTIQRESFDNVPASAFGVAWSSPLSVGSSTEYYRNFTTGQNIDLGSNQNNLTMYVKTDPIPSPSAASLLAASSLLALRRRRS